MDYRLDQKLELGLTYDDVLLVPQLSDIDSRDNVDTTTELSPGLTLRVPIISANMDSITGVEMAIAMDDLGGLGILHRFMSPDEMEDSVSRLVEKKVKYPAISVGLDTGIEQVKHLVKLGAKVVCVDVAHGHHTRVINYTKKLKREIFRKAHLIVGNVATFGAALDLSGAGADIIKVGIGPGSLCTTRLQTGCGIPQLTAIFNTASVKPVIADGGIKHAGDITKALAAGASAVMIGSLFAGTDEAAMKSQYRGMASRQAQTSWKSATPTYIEGEAKTVPPKGPVSNVVKELTAGLRSGMSYIGARTTSELWKAKFIRMTPAGYTESTPHGVNK